MMSWIRSAAKQIFYTTVESCVRPSASIKPGSVLLIRTDAIGDYVLFRNFIKVLSESRKYGNHEVTLVGNTAWKELAEKLDARHVSRFIWIDRYRFEHSPRYRYKKLQQITAHGYSVVINAIYSRSYGLSDRIARTAVAAEKIAFDGDTSNISLRQKRFADRYYTRLIPASGELMFEFYQNRRLFEHLLDKPIELQRPQMQCDTQPIPFKLPARFAVLFIGASKPASKWPVEKFAELAQSLYDQHALEIVILGGPEDQPAAKKFESICSLPVTNLAGMTSIIEYAQVLAVCSLLVSNETSAPHLAQALGPVPTVVIYSGLHFGRFVPYPGEIAGNYRVALHPEVEQDPAEYRQKSNFDTDFSPPAIGQISVAAVYAQVLSLLNGC